MNNKLKYRMMFFEGEGGGGGGGDTGAGGGGGESLGGSVFNPPPGGETGGKALPMEKKIEQHDPQVPAQDGPKPAGFDPSKFAQEFGESVAKSLKGAAVPAPPPMTKEEAEKILNTWNPDDAWYTRYDNLETRKAAVAEMRDGLIRQADTIAQLRMQEELQKLRDEYAPQMTMIEEHYNAQREQRFHGTFPQLKNPGLQPLISAVTEDLIKQGKSFTSEGEMFKAVADGVAAVIKVTNPEFTLETAGSSPASDGRNNNQIPVTTPGAGGGTGRSTAPQKGSTKRGLAVFE
jgi:hypothetical protein